jgi:hypothetical protein
MQPASATRCRRGIGEFAEKLRETGSVVPYVGMAAARIDRIAGRARTSS